MRVSVDVFSVAQFFPLQLASLTGAEHYLPWLLAVCKAGWQAAVDSMNWLGTSTGNHNVYHEISRVSGKFFGSVETKPLK